MAFWRKWHQPCFSSGPESLMEIIAQFYSQTRWAEACLLVCSWQPMKWVMSRSFLSFSKPTTPPRSRDKRLPMSWVPRIYGLLRCRKMGLTAMSSSLRDGRHRACSQVRRQWRWRPGFGWCVSDRWENPSPTAWPTCLAPVWVLKVQLLVTTDRQVVHSCSGLRWGTLPVGWPWILWLSTSPICQFSSVTHSYVLLQVCRRSSCGPLPSTGANHGGCCVTKLLSASFRLRDWKTAGQGKWHIGSTVSHGHSILWIFYFIYIFKFLGLCFLSSKRWKAAALLGFLFPTVPCVLCRLNEFLGSWG